MTLDRYKSIFEEFQNNIIKVQKVWKTISGKAMDYMHDSETLFDEVTYYKKLSKK